MRKANWHFKFPSNLTTRGNQMSNDQFYDILSYRKDVVGKFFRNFESGDSFYVLGAPSMGKTRLLDFLTGDFRYDDKKVDGNKIKQHYLNNDLALRSWLVRVDMNRIGQEADWVFNFYELLLSTLLAVCIKENGDKEILNELNRLDSEVILDKDTLKAHRYFELATSKLCQMHSIKICFLFDEFDHTYKTMPSTIFSQLRATRDANKYNLSYALFLRNLPDKIRDPNDNEGFYELISDPNKSIGVGPYNKSDSFYMIQQLEKRRGVVLTPDKREWIYKFSGGHSGLILALLSLIKDNPRTETKLTDAEWIANQEIVFEEIRKLWGGLLSEEKNGLVNIAANKADDVDYSTGKLLVAKGLVQNRSSFFSPLIIPCLNRLKK